MTLLELEERIQAIKKINPSAMNHHIGVMTNEGKGWEGPILLSNDGVFQPSLVLDPDAKLSDRVCGLVTLKL